MNNLGLIPCSGKSLKSLQILHQTFIITIIMTPLFKIHVHSLLADWFSEYLSLPRNSSSLLAVWSSNRICSELAGQTWQTGRLGSEQAPRGNIELTGLQYKISWSVKNDNFQTLITPSILKISKFTKMLMKDEVNFDFAGAIYIYSHFLGRKFWPCIRNY